MLNIHDRKRDSALSKALGRIRKSRLGQNAAWMLLGQLASFGLQAGYFILLARVLGVVQYGIFSGAFALVNTLMPYSAVGSNMLFMRYVGADPRRASVYWGNTLVTTTFATCGILVLIFFFGPSITGVPDRWMLVLLTLSTCFFNQLVICASSVFQTFERMKISATFRFSTSFCRFAVLLAMFLVWHQATARQWSVGMLVASSLPAVWAWYQVRKAIPEAHSEVATIKKQWREGLGFAFANSTQYAYNDIDKTMLTHFKLDAQSGFYSLAYKVIDFATVPIGSIDIAVLPRYFSMVEQGLPKALRLLRKILAINVGLGLAITVMVFAISPLVPMVVGTQYAGAIVAMRILCLIPLFRGIHTAIGSMLTGMGFQNLRTIAQVSAAGGNILLNLWAIPRYGWRGAAYTSVATDTFLALFCGILLCRVYWKYRTTAATLLEH